MAIIFRALSRLLAPILTFTADESMAYFLKNQAYGEQSVHTMDWPEVSEIEDFKAVAEVDEIIGFREKIHEKLEALRQNKVIGQSLDAKVIIGGNGDVFEILKKYEKDLPEFFIVSQVVLEENSGEISVEALSCPWERCQRSWRRVPKLVEYGEFKNISERCKLALEEKFLEK
jgi:isoleucyl-tRNA synthetase